MFLSLSQINGERIIVNSDKILKMSKFLNLEGELKGTIIIFEGIENSLLVKESIDEIFNSYKEKDEKYLKEYK